MLIPVIDSMLKLADKNIKIEPIQHSVHNLQIAIYWFKVAEKGLENIGGETLESNTTSTNTLPVRTRPTLLGNTDTFNYISTSLRTISEEVLMYKEQGGIPDLIKYSMDRGYDKLMEAKFNMQIAQMYYGELNK